MTDIFDPRFPLAHTGLIGSPIERDDRIQRSPETLWAARMHPGARWMVLDGLNPLLDEDGPDIAWLRRSEVPEAAVEVYLGLEDGNPRFAVTASATGLSGTPVDARRAAMLMDDGRAAIIAQARSLIDWHQRHGFCANCGAPTEMVKAGYGRNCGGCGAEHFPRTDPVVIMLAIDGDRVLLGRQSRFPKGSLSALAGFVEAGECFEDAVRREIREEAGILTGRVVYVASQPWPFPSSLMIGCFAEALSTEISIDEVEMEEVRWLTRDECVAALAGNGSFTVPPPLAIARTLLETWLAATA
ncbi:NAD(+) diphosphatase [Sphingosinicella sp.]|uniref:NAD(+) diphosphatase n=1 Tax=Sphingosinicella sp. TaxID=1917971 RepID=UPI0035AE6FF7